MAALEIVSLTKRYGKARGVEDVSFAVERGEVFGYLGPNGSGKTTTIRCIMGLLRPTHGEVHLLDKSVAPGRATQHARVGYLPGDFRIWGNVKAGRCLRLFGAMGTRDDHMEKRRRELAERLDIDIGRRVGDLSKGNRQKVAVLYAFQHRPEVLILDEPTAGLDPLVRQVVMDLIREAAEEGTAVLLSSHDLSEVSAICGRAGILREGRLVEVAPISRIVQQGERRLKVWFIDQTQVVNIPPGQLEGVRVIERQPGMIHVAYQGRCDGLLKWLSQFPIDRIMTPQTSLEEAFIQYYRQAAHAGRQEIHHE
jgi:ABC-2 type transport system ATP-binding protein